MEWHVRSKGWRAAAFAAVWWVAGTARAQIAITEIMVNPNGDDGPWEWVEILNTSAEPVDLNGWIFQDDDGAPLAAPNMSNIQSTGGNTTIVPGHGVAVLYPGDALAFMPERFRAAWGAGITLIAVNTFGNGLANDGDALGLWKSFTDYTADALPGTMSPRRTFGHAVASIDYNVENGYPEVVSARSLAWNGAGTPLTAGNWVLSANGALGAHVSVQTTRPGAAINDIADRGTPGAAPPGVAATGLLISEIMYDPASSEPAWEWVEVVNNTGSAIDFGATPHVFDDVGEGPMSTANIRSGTIAQGATAVLFNATATGGNTLANMKAAWGGSVNFIPVSPWTELTNTGDTIAIWSSLAAYQDETESSTSPRRTTTHAAAVVTYDDSAALGWPANNDSSSIFRANLSSNPALPASWTRSTNANSSAPQPVLGEVVDHLGNDTGSPGFVPGVITSLPGDFDGNGKVDTADYVFWRENIGTQAKYDEWRGNFGAGAAAASVASGSVQVPEPAGLVLLVLGLAGLCWPRATSDHGRVAL